MPKRPALDAAERAVRGAALAYPEAYEETPWGHPAFKVRNKGFLYMSRDPAEDRFSMSAKLPSSHVMAVGLPFAEPTGYGLGKSGWVSATFRGAEKPPVELLLEWIDESYRAIAPKRLVKTLDGDGPEGGAIVSAKKRATAATKAGAKSKTKAKAKANVSRRVRESVLVISTDAKRVERAQASLDEHGFETQWAPPDEEALVEGTRRRPAAIVIDLGRRAPAGLELAAMIDATDLREVPLAFAGARDAKTERRARSIGAGPVLVSRRPPGDPAFARALAERL